VRDAAANTIRPPPADSDPAPKEDHSRPAGFNSDAPGSSSSSDSMSQGSRACLEIFIKRLVFLYLLRCIVGRQQCPDGQLAPASR